MANYHSFQRTNYVRVTDEVKFKELMGKVGAELWEQTNRAGEKVFAWGEYDSDVYSYYNDDTDEDVEVLPELQALLPEGELLIIKGVGHEKLRGLNGFVILVTKDKIESFNLDGETKRRANEMGIKDFSWPEM
jgi:hypothetical protein